MKKKKVKVIDYTIVVAEFKSSLFYKPTKRQEIRKTDLEGKLNLRNELNEKFYGVHERDGAYKFFNLTIPQSYKLYLDDVCMNNYSFDRLEFCILRKEVFVYERRT